MKTRIFCRDRTYNRTYKFNNSKFSFDVLFFLVIASFAASAAEIVYVKALEQDVLTSSIALVLEKQSFDFLFATLPLATLGLWLGSKVGLGAPKLRAILTKVRSSYRRFQFLIIIAAYLGIFGGIFILFINFIFLSVLPPEVIEIEMSGFFPALCSAFSIAVKQEIWLRLGTMTFIVWLGSKLTQQPRPSKALMWSANLLTILVESTVLYWFQAPHLAQEFIPLLPVYIMLRYGVVSLIFGWLYWRGGLLSAMIAHFSTNLVIYFIPM